jgi:hypothetical protein
MQNASMMVLHEWLIFLLIRVVLENTYMQQQLTNYCNYIFWNMKYFKIHISVFFWKQSKYQLSSFLFWHFV